MMTVRRELIEALAGETPKAKAEATNGSRNGSHKGNGKWNARAPSAAAIRCRGYVQKISPAVWGEHGSDRTFHAARFIWNDCGLDEADGYPILEEFNRTSCHPPWEDADLRRKWDEAVKKGPGPEGRGFKLREWDEKANGSQTQYPADRKPNLTDVGNGLRFAAEHGEVALYVPAWGWTIWDGACHRRDDLHRAEMLAKQTAARLYQEALAELGEVKKQIDGCGDEDGDRKKALEAQRAAAQQKLAWAVKSEDAKRIGAMLRMARSELAEPSDKFDSHPMLFNVPNGTIDLTTGRLRPHDRGDYLTRLCSTAYKPDARCPVWEKFVRAIFAGDEALIGFIQRWAGFALTGDTSEHVLPIFHGSGANGKSTFLETVMSVVGTDYAMKAGAELLLVRKGEAHPTERADLHGRRLVCCVETDDGRRLAGSLVKEMTGGDRIRARFMRQDFFEFVSTHKLVLATNHRPRVKERDYAMWRRLALVPFNVRFWNPDETETADEERDETLRADKCLKAKLLAEREGILAWLVRGCLDWQVIGLKRPEAVEAASKEYRNDEDLVGRFAEERLEFAPQLEVRANALYAGFRGWCDSIGEPPISQTAFGRAMTDQGVTKKQSNGTVYVGVNFRDD